ncbi:hypothetical protein Tco_0070795 [Tanacetum coccineum]
MITSPNTSGVQELSDTFATVAYVICESPHNTFIYVNAGHKGSKSNALGTISYRRCIVYALSSGTSRYLGDGYGVHREGWQWCSRMHATTTRPHDATQTAYQFA